MHNTWRKKKKGQSDIEFLVEAIDLMSVNQGKWLARIAEAIAENDAERLQQLAASLRASTDSLEQAVSDNQVNEGE